MTKVSLRILYLVVLVMLVLAACAPKSPATATTEPTEPPATQAPTEPVTELSVLPTETDVVAAQPTPTLVTIDLSGPPMEVGSTYLYVDGSTLVAVPAG